MATVASLPLVTPSGLSKPQFAVQDYTSYNFAGGKYPYATFAQRVSSLQDFAETRYPSAQPMLIAGTLGIVTLLGVLGIIVFGGIGSPKTMFFVFLTPLIMAYVVGRVRRTYKMKLMAFEQNLRHLLSRFTAEDANTYGIKWQLQDLNAINNNGTASAPAQFVVDIVDLTAAMSVVMMSPPPAYVNAKLPTYDELDRMSASGKPQTQQSEVAPPKYSGENIV